MPITRREFLIGAGAVAGASIVGVAGPAFGAAAVDPASANRNRLVVIFLEGGNDGLNYVVPRGDVPGAPRLSVYRKVRPALAYAPSTLLPLDRGGDADQMLGFNPKLTHLHSLYRAGRVAIVQGVDYPNHNYSHFASSDIWHAGNPANTSTGWIGRHLDRVGVGEGELRAVAVSSKLPLMLQGRGVSGASIASIATMRFRDGTNAASNAKHAALAALGAARANDPLRQRVGATLRQAVDVVGDLAKTDAPPARSSGIGESLATARTLLEQNLGVESVYVGYGGFDTHTTQVSTQEQLLADLDTALDAFWAGLNPSLADRTLVMIVSEFGRRIGQASGGFVAGTDHGAAAPVVFVGPPQSSLVGGVHGDHPNMGTTAAPADNLAMTTDVRHVYQAVLQSWLHNPDPLYNDAESGPLHGLFDEASTAAGGRGRNGAAARLNGTGSESSTSTSSAVLGTRASRRRSALGFGGSDTSNGGGRSVPLSSATAALAFNAFVAAIVVRSGRFREALASWRDDDSAL
ncbi:MAG: hypothetical protein QOK28_3910 [Actinomycetota bacterium]|jgi:uncharacterized protein (DUF1501 family)